MQTDEHERVDLPALNELVRVSADSLQADGHSHCKCNAHQMMHFLCHAKHSLEALGSTMLRPGATTEGRQI